MADAKKCDRCCNYYDKNNNKQGLREVRTYGKSGWVTAWDLCDECLAKFEKFISGVELEEVEQYGRD